MEKQAIEWMDGSRQGPLPDLSVPKRSAEAAGDSPAASLASAGSDLPKASEKAGADQKVADTSSQSSGKPSGPETGKASKAGKKTSEKANPETNLCPEAVKKMADALVKYEMKNGWLLKQSREEATSHTLNNTLYSLSVAATEMGLSEEKLLEVGALESIKALFSDVKDRRDPSKITYATSNILAMIFIAILSDHTFAFTRIAVYIEKRKDLFVSLGLLDPSGPIPSHDTLRYVMRKLWVDTLEAEVIIKKLKVLMDSLGKSMENTDRKRRTVYNGDGKNQNGTDRKKDTHNPRKAWNMLNFYEAGSGVCIKTVPVTRETLANDIEGLELMDPDDRKKTNEIPVAQKVIEELKDVLRGNIVTFDALHCQTKTCAKLIKCGADYVLCAKGNQLNLCRMIASKFNAEYKNLQVIIKQNRAFMVILLSDDDDRMGFEGMNAIVVMFSKTHSKKEKDSGVRFFITSLTNVELIIDVIIQRWAVENDLHAGKDVLGEDKMRCTNENACHGMAVLGNIAYFFVSLFKELTNQTRTAACMTLRYHVSEGVSAILALVNSTEMQDSLKKSMGVVARRRQVMAF